MKSESLLESLATWTPEQLLAFHDFCQLMGETIWQHHSQTLIDHLRTADSAPRIDWPKPTVEENLQLPFDDDLTF